MNKQWTIIEQYASVLKNTQLKELFIEDVDRSESFTVTLPHAYVDYSRQRINRQLRQELCTFAREIGLRDAFTGMMHGNIMNSTEQRSVLHTALRAPKQKQIKVNGKDIIPEIHAVLERIRAFSGSIRSGEITGYTGKPFTDIVNKIGRAHV